MYYANIHRVNTNIGSYILFFLLDSIGEGRPFVLASHSQGGYHLSRLLEEVVDGDAKMRQRLIVAYLVGSRVPLDKFASATGRPGLSYDHIRESTSPLDHTGCVVGWDTTSEHFHSPFPKGQSETLSVSLCLPLPLYLPLSVSPSLSLPPSHFHSLFLKGQGFPHIPA